MLENRYMIPQKKYMSELIWGLHICFKVYVENLCFANFAVLHLSPC